MVAALGWGWRQGFFDFEALYLEDLISKSYEISLVCKKGFQNCYTGKSS